MLKDSVFKKNTNMVTRIIDGEAILLPIFKTSDEINCIYTLNKPATKIWEMIDGKKTLSQIKSKVLQEFDTTPSQAEQKMKSLLDDLKKIKAVK